MIPIQLKRRTEHGHSKKHQMDLEVKHQLIVELLPVTLQRESIKRDNEDDNSLEYIQQSTKNEQFRDKQRLRT